jgi:exoribonuclease R
VAASGVVRAIVRSRAQLTYEQVQAEVDAGTGGDVLAGLRAVGEARQRQEAARGGVSLDLPSQRVEATGDRYRIEFEATVPAMGWNEQVSLLVGMVAAERMVAAGVGLLRTLPPPERGVVAQVRRTARALGVAWPDGASYAEVVRGLRGDVPDEAALLALASRGLRGAGYLALPVPPEADEDGREAGEGAAAGGGDRSRDDGPPQLAHAAVAAPYAHVTAPLRRLVDRYGAEACLAVEAGEAVPAWVRDALPGLPATMRAAGAREANAGRAAVDLVEALVLRPLVGQRLVVTVVSADEGGSTVVCREPAIQARIRDATLPLGEAVEVTVVEADPAGPTVTLAPAG